MQNLTKPETAQISDDRQDFPLDQWRNLEFGKWVGNFGEKEMAIRSDILASKNHSGHKKFLRAGMRQIVKQGGSSGTTSLLRRRKERRSAEGLGPPENTCVSGKVSEIVENDREGRVQHWRRLSSLSPRLTETTRRKEIREARAPQQAGWQNALQTSTRVFAFKSWKMMAQWKIAAFNMTAKFDSAVTGRSTIQSQKAMQKCSNYILSYSCIVK